MMFPRPLHAQIPQSDQPPSPLMAQPYGDVDDGSQLPLEHIIVLTNEGRRFKMVMRGSLARLSVAKIKRYLEKSTKVPMEHQILTYDGRLLSDDMVGRDFGLAPEGVFQLSFAAAFHQQQASRTSDPPADHGAAMMPATPQPSAIGGSMPTTPRQQNGGGGVVGFEQDPEGRERQGMHQRMLYNNAPLPAASSSSLRPAAAHNDVSRNSNALWGGATQPSSSAVPGPSPYGMDRDERMARMTTPYHAQQQTSTGDARFHADLTLVGRDPPALQGASSAAAAFHTAPSLGALHPLETKVAVLEDENRALRGEIERLRRQDMRAGGPGGSIATPGQSIIAAAKANLQELSKELGQHLAFDDSLSCVVGADEANSVVLTVDPPTERLYIYSTIATSLPRDSAVRLRLFEALLEWSMLGRDLAGGSIGICPRTGIAMLSTSVDLKHANHFALRDTAPLFIEALVRWRREANNLVSGLAGLAPIRAPPSPPRPYYPA